MRKKFIQFAEIICSDESILSVLKELKEICSQEELYHEEGGCLEKIWHITHDNQLYEEVGDIFLYKVRNKDIANAAYNKYIYHTNPDFYFKYATNMHSMGFYCIDTENTDEDLPESVTNLCDRFDAIAYMMIYLHKKEDYDGVLELVKYLENIKSKIFAYKETDRSDKLSYWDDIVSTEKHLSEIFTKTQNRNDINQLAIDLDKYNEKGYYNILKDLITYDNYDEAIAFYNNQICENFKNKPINDIKSLCWAVSDFYSGIYEFYNAVFMQKIALEMEMKEEKVNA